MLRIIATPCLAEELKPGDLFSTRGPAYWDGFHDFYSCGEALYVRTGVPAHNFPDPDTVVFRITIQKEVPNDQA